jgi:serine/threonine protein kinase
MKNVILAEPSTLALLGLGFFLLIFAVVAVLGAVAVSVVFLTRKARREAPQTSPPSSQPISKNCPKCGASTPPDSPEGLCPRCLIALNLATQTEIPGEPGAVYKARQTRLDRLVALKILSPEKQGNQKFSERFEREARALAKLHHPNIVTVFDFGEVDGNFYLLMEFVDGLTLRQLLQTRKLLAPEALAIVPKICEALQYAHEQGIVHRDIKPENILMDKDGRVKIADFGIAKILGDGGNSNLTAEQVIGTPHYMSPEQIEKPQTVDHRADIYSLGVVFYEMLTGELPLGKFPPPSKKVQVDVRLDEVVLRALEKEPERRYQQASEVKTRVETIANNHGGTRQGSPASFGSTMSRFAVPGVAVLIIIALAIFFFSRSSHLSQPGSGAIKPNDMTNESKASFVNTPVPVRLNPNDGNEDQANEAAQIIDEQPPVVVETFPISGARDVAPGDMEIRVRFSKDMTHGSWSWSTVWEDSNPESLGPPHYLDDHPTCVVKVHLEPGKTYVWWLNSDKFKGFADIAGQPAVPYLFSFQTKIEVKNQN